jgi:hypothetical protein
MVKDYNDSYHTSLRASPHDVFYEGVIPYQKKDKIPSVLNLKFKVGDYVRISKKKKLFDKGYETRWIKEVFQIYKIDSTRQPVMYELVDLQGEDVTGKFYEAELQPTKLKNLFLLKSLVKTETINGKIMNYISFEGYPSKFNVWVSEHQYQELLKTRVYHPEK